MPLLGPCRRGNSPGTYIGSEREKIHDVACDGSCRASFGGDPTSISGHRDPDADRLGAA